MCLLYQFLLIVIIFALMILRKIFFRNLNVVMWHVCAYQNCEGSKHNYIRIYRMLLYVGMRLQPPARENAPSILHVQLTTWHCWSKRYNNAKLRWFIKHWLCAFLFIWISHWSLMHHSLTSNCLLHDSFVCYSLDTEKKEKKQTSLKNSSSLFSLILYVFVS